MSNRSKIDAHCVGTGFVALDIIRCAVDANTTLERRHAGGTCGNVLAILAYLGMRATAVGRIGGDPAATELRADLQQWKVDLKLLTPEPGGRTPVVVQESYLDSKGRPKHRFSRECPVCGARMPAYRPLLVADVSEIAAALAPHGCFFFDRVAPGVLELAKRSRQQGALVVFEPSGVKDEKLFVECLRASHVFKYSHERLSGIDPLVAEGRPTVEIETRGSAGLRFRNWRGGRRSSWTELGALPAPALRDSAGSGDWCTAGFLAKMRGEGVKDGQGLADLERVREALRFGQALAALNCAYDGARGMMYAMSRTQVHRAAQRLLANETPRLAVVRSPQPRTSSSDRACIVCASDRQVAQA